MTENKKQIGNIEWRDLTVNNAEEVRDFYSQVIGWTSSTVSMGDYDDYCMNNPESGDTIAGVCHARGSNSNLPAQWLMYVRVEDITKSIESCEKLGGKVLDGPRALSGNQFCVIEDPAGAVLALFSGDE